MLIVLAHRAGSANEPPNSAGDPGRDHFGSSFRVLIEPETNVRSRTERNPARPRSGKSDDTMEHKKAVEPSDSASNRAGFRA